MKVLQIIPRLVTGGAERFVVELSNELANQKYDCYILSFYKPDEAVNLKAQDAVHQDIIPKRSGFDFSLMFKIIRYIKKKEIDVVHAHVSAIKYILLASFILPKVKFVATIHSEASREAGKSIDKWSRKLMFKFGRCTPVTISEESLLSFEKFYGRTAPMVYNGIAYSDVSNLRLKDNDEQLIFLHPATCQPIKNQALLFQAFNKFAMEYPNVKLIWVGENRANEQYFDEVKKLMGRCIEYHGPVMNVRDYLYSSDAMCLSSRMEGMPMTVIEAFSVGCVPLCTPVGGCLNMIENGINGYLSNDMSVEAYYKMLKEFYLLSSGERSKIKFCAKQAFEKFSIQKCLDGYLRIYEENSIPRH